MNKNWSQICEIGKQDWCLMMALAFADSETPLGKSLIKAFPRCFSKGKLLDRVPLSVLKEYAENRAPYKGYGSPETALASVVLEDSNSPFHLPFIRLAKIEEYHEQYGFPLLPSNIPKEILVGSVVCYKGKKHVVVENVYGEICLAPTTCIYVDIEPYS
jgi:hypothetical protein